MTNNIQELIERIEKHLLYLKEPQVMVAPATVFLLVSCKAQLQQAQKMQEALKLIISYDVPLDDYLEPKNIRLLANNFLLAVNTAKQALNEDL